MDEILDQMVEFVGENVKCTRLSFRYTIGEREGRSVRFHAAQEWDVLEVSVVVGDVFTCFDCAIEACYW